MGLEFSCTGSETNALEEGFCSIANSGLLSVNHHRTDSKAKLLNAFGSGKFVFEGSLSFKRKEPNPFCLETEISMKSSNAENSNSAKRTKLNEEEPASPKHDAAIKLQKVYKSFRTRRQLADCAVLVEQKWWKLLDFALLKRSSVSFFDIDKPESAVSKWSRARTRAAKVGKGLSKNSKAQKLALQHWLEAIDPRHRYGHNLHFYYDSWLLCESKQPFFYWLDVGEGKEVNLEACSRLKLQQQCIKYLGPKEREAYEVIVEEGRLIYKKSRETLDTTGGLKDAKWIFVLSTSKNLYVGLKKKGRFQHSSFLAGGATSAAGRLVVENGVLKAVWPHSGHYRPTEENFEEFMSFLEENNVALTDVKKSPDEDDEEWVSVLRSRDSESDLTSSSIYTESKIRSELLDSLALDGKAVASKDLNSAGQRDQAELMKLFVFDGKSIISDEQTSEEEEEEEEEEEAEEEDKGSNSSIDSNQNYKTNKCLGDEPLEISSPSKRPLIFHKPNLFIEEKEEGESDELIIKRISSTKALKQSQLETKLPFKWTTGTGARIGYVRNYPSELQFRALEQVNLSPRGLGISRPFSSPRAAPSPRPRAQEFERDCSSTKTTLRDSSL